MFRPESPRQPVPVAEFPIASPRIQRAMPLLRSALKDSPELRRKVFQVEFLSTLSGELLTTLIYHRPLADDWLEQAVPVAEAVNSRLIGRSRGQRLVLTEDYVDEILTIEGRDYSYRQPEQGFTQPNAAVNLTMIHWACGCARDLGGDLLELYCGNGNFTLPLANHFDRVLATELSKNSIRAARHNVERNALTNLQLARLSAQEMSEALAGVRPFRRLQQLDPALQEHEFSTVLVDPPRAGLDAATEALVGNFDQIIYISCNPLTLTGNLRQLCATHRVERLAFFDQFPYTDHMECGVLLKRY
jgi:tRNA (uracil-5-)-methyltransferase